MKIALKAVLNIAATFGLFIWVLTWIAWTPGYAALTNWLIYTSAWRHFGAAIARLRLALGASIGPLDDEPLLVDCTAALSLALAILLVWSGNRAVHAVLTARRRARSQEQTAGA